MTKVRQPQGARAAYGELDEIVVQLFDDLAGEGALARHAHSAPMRGSQAQRNSRRHYDRSSFRPETTPRYDAGRRLAQSKASKSQSDRPTPRGRVRDDFDLEQLFADESLHRENAEAVTPEEAEFIKDAAAWLAQRPNADLLLDLLEETLWRGAVAASQDEGVENEPPHTSAASPATAEEKPPSEGK